MKIERLKENNKKKWIIGVIVFILLVSTIALVTSRAKYKVTQKIKLVEGTINFSRSDINIVALYDASGSSINTIPSGTWGVDQTKSFCTTDGSSNISNKDSSLTISIINNKISVSNITKKNTKCFVYLKSERTVEEVINSLELAKDKPDFSIPAPVLQTHVATSNMKVGTGTGIYTATDDDGVTYYYRGAVTNNYLKFAGKCWRIIRFNGDGSIRIIYDGATCHANGTVTDDSIAIKSVAFNKSSGKAEYAGYMYTIGNKHGNGTSSNIKNELDTWYNSYLKSYANYIDMNAGFCGDRSLSQGTGTGTAGSSYRSRDRLVSNVPTFHCPEAEYDLYTTSSSTKGNKALTNPIGLITFDEVIFAGGNDYPSPQYYLYNGQGYWTMTPAWSGFKQTIQAVFATGRILTAQSINKTARQDYGARPVINLKSNVVLSGNGTQKTPYEVVGLS